MHIFIVHNNINEIRFLKATLENAQHTVDYEMDNELIQEFLLSENFDVILINSKLNNLDAIKVISEYRAQNKKAPILFISEAGHGIHRGILALENGADDFMVFPVNPRELLARINVFFRKLTGHNHRAFKLGPLEIDSLFREYRLDGKRVELSVSEGKVLEALIKQPEHIVSKEEIAFNLFSMEDQIACNRVQPHICRLRKKLQHPNIKIKTIYNFGYSLELKEN